MDINVKKNNILQNISDKLTWCIKHHYNANDIKEYAAGVYDEGLKCKICIHLNDMKITTKLFGDWTITLVKIKGMYNT